MMKRLLFFAALIVAIGSIGGNMLTAHAQTAPTVTMTTVSSLTPAQIAAIKQQLQVAQATLINLEMQNGIATPTDAGTPSAIPDVDRRHRLAELAGSNRRSNGALCKSDQRFQNNVGRSLCDTFAAECFACYQHDIGAFARNGSAGNTERHAGHARCDGDRRCERRQQPGSEQRADCRYAVSQCASGSEQRAFIGDRTRHTGWCRADSSADADNDSEQSRATDRASVFALVIHQSPLADHRDRLARHCDPRDLVLAREERTGAHGFDRCGRIGKA